MKRSVIIGIITGGLFGLVLVCPWQPVSSNASQAIPPSPQLVKAVEQLRKRDHGRFMAMRDVQATVPLVQEFLGVFPAAKVESKYLSLSGGSGYEATVPLYERYELSMQLLVHFDNEFPIIAGYAKPRFTLHEVKSVTINKSGQPELIFDPARERNFGANEWRKIVESGGDLGSIGYTLVTNQPIAGFKDWQFSHRN